MTRNPEKARAGKRRYLDRRKAVKYGPDSVGQDLRGHHKNHPSGPNHYRWNDGRIISEHGYVKIRVGREHQLADPNGYAYEHLVVWCAAGRGRPAITDVIHHKNEDKTDNRLDNLELKPRGRHGVEHQGAIADESVLAIRLQYASGVKDMPLLATEYGLPVSRVSKYIRGESRVSAGGPISHNNRKKKEPR